MERVEGSDNKRNSMLGRNEGGGEAEGGEVRQGHHPGCMEGTWKGIMGVGR